MQVLSYIKNKFASIEFALEWMLCSLFCACVNKKYKYEIDKFIKQGGIFDYFAINKKAIFEFLIEVQKERNCECHILEFGSGQSTLFLSRFVENVNQNIRLTSFEHDKAWHIKVKSQIANNLQVDFVYSSLRTVDEKTRLELFKNPASAPDLWNKHSKAVDEDRYMDTRLKNAFYDMSADLPRLQSVDAMILDGPHGNGRSIAFPMLYQHLKPGSVVLIDDYHHYPFLEDLHHVFDYDIIKKRRYLFSNNGWALVRIVKRK